MGDGPEGGGRAQSESQARFWVWSRGAVCLSVWWEGAWRLSRREESPWHSGQAASP